MSEVNRSNLRNQPRCNAHSKRTGERCRQPAMKMKEVCRLHGGKSTGPRTVEGRQRIRASKVMHGRYSKITEENKSSAQMFKSFDQVLKHQMEYLKMIRKWLDVYEQVESKPEFRFLNLFLFGNLNQMVKKNPVLREQLRELFELLFQEDRSSLFQALFTEMEKLLCRKFELSVDEMKVWQALSPEQKESEFIQRFCLKLFDVRLALGKAKDIVPLDFPKYEPSKRCEQNMLKEFASLQKAEERLLLE